MNNELVSVVGLKLDQVIDKVPAEYRDQVRTIAGDYWQILAKMGAEDLYSYLSRLGSGDLEVIVQLNSQLSDKDFILKMKENTIKWSNIAKFNETRDKLCTEFLLRSAPIVFQMIAAMVGL